MGATATLGWQFVHISDPKTARDPATRRFVRATVAANYHRKEREHHSLAHVTGEDDTAKAGKNKQRKKKQKLSLRIASLKEVRVDERSIPSPQALSVPGQVEPTDNADEDNHGSTKPPPSVSSLRSLTNALTTGHNDPWGVRFTGVEYQPDYGSLLQYFVLIIDPFYCPFGSDNGRKNLRYSVSPQQSLADAALYKSILFAASAHRDYSSGRAISRAALKYKGETIHLIHASLSCTPDCISDFTLTAIAMLAVTMNLTQETHEQGLHINAVKNLLRSRGAIDPLAMQKILHVYISWQDLVCSLVTKGPARFVQLHCNAFMRPSSYFYFRGVATDLEEIANSIPWPRDIRDVILPIFRDLHYLHDMMRFFYKLLVPCDRMYMAWSQVRASLDHRAMDLMASPEHQKSAYYSTLISCCMAALSQTHLDIRVCDPTCAAVRTAKELLFARFDDPWYDSSTAVVDIHSGWSLRLWALCTGAVAVLNEEELNWYATRILCCIYELGLHESWEVEEQLRKYIWTSASSSFFTTRTWPKIMAILASSADESSPSSSGGSDTTQYFSLPE